MNEEKLPQYNPRLTSTENFKIAFQKGRTQALAEVKEIINNFDLREKKYQETKYFKKELLSQIDNHSQDKKGYPNIPLDQRHHPDTLRGLKEIGGNSK